MVEFVSFNWEGPKLIGNWEGDPVLTLQGRLTAQ